MIFPHAKVEYHVIIAPSRATNRASAGAPTRDPGPGDRSPGPGPASPRQSAGSRAGHFLRFGFAWISTLGIGKHFVSP